MNRSKVACVESRSNSFKLLNLKYLAILVLAMVALPFLAFGQDAAIVGTVTDPAGSVVPNATVTLTHVETSKIRVLTTSESGQYAADALEIGHYNIKAEITGFKIAERQNVVLNVAQRERIDFQLAIGTTAESISVEGDAVAVQSDSGEQSSLLTGQQLTQLQTNGRSIYNVVNLTTGASSLQSDFQVPTPVGGNANVSFNGNRIGHNIYLLDGGENLDRGGSGTFSVMPSLDALSETQIQTSNYSAQYGLSSGATITTVVRSGTKDFHASAWEFLRNNDLDARNFFNPAPQTVAKLNFNTYGFNIGGPVTLGKLYNQSRTKTFFFYNMEWRSLIQGAVLNQTVPANSEYPTASGADFGSTAITVPTVAQVDPSVLFANCPGGAAPTGIVQGSAFPGNTIPSCMISPNASALLTAGGKYGGIFPAATGVNSNGLAVFQGGNNTPTNVREEVVRIDENVTDKFTIFGHFIAEQISQGFGTTMWSGDNVPSASNSFGNPSYSGVVHSAYVINPNLVNELSFNYNGNRINIAPTGLYAAPADFTFNRFFNTPNDLNRIPSIQLSGTTGSNYTVNWVPWQNDANDYQIRDDVSWTHGRHQIKFGASWALYTKVQNLFAPTQGSFVFNGGFTGNDFADYLLGDAQNYSENAVQDSGHWNNQSWALYIEDNYRVNNRLTLNLGLRWDGVPHTYEANNRASNFYPNLYNTVTPAQIFTDPANPNAVSPSAPYLGTSPNALLAGQEFYLNGIGISGQPGIPRGLVQNHWLAFGPRIGFAYDLNGNGKTVIRGGFGIMYERIQGNDMYNAGPDVPFSASVSFNDVSLNNPHTQLTGGSVPAGGIPVSSITGLNSNQYQLPQSYQFSLGLQQAIGRSVFSAAYVGSQNRHQNFYQETNLADQSLLPGFLCSGCATDYNASLPYLGFHSVELAQNEANGDYNSIQLAMRGTVKTDLTYQLGYTYAHSNDPSTNGTGSGGDLNPVSNPYAGWKYDFGPSAFDRRNVFFANFVYQIPFLKNSENKLLKATVGGWEVSGVVTAESGAPVNLTIGSFDGSPCNVVPNCSERPDVSGSIIYPHTVGQWFSVANFSAPAAGTWGDLGHNAIRGPGRDNWNLALFKNFLLSESHGLNLQFRAEFFNVWNHTQFQGDVGNGGIANSISFTSTGAFAGGNTGAITSAYDPRTIQLGLKLLF